MTPRAFWDRDGYLYEENAADGGRLRLIYNPSTGWSRAANDGSGSFGDRDIVEHLYGPLVGVA